jgi:hypothetical protein
MSAAATAAGYLYASGRLRGREKREGEAEKPEGSHDTKPRAERPRIEKPVRVAAMPAREDLRERSGPRKTPTIQYRTRRWKPEPHGE